MSIRTVDLRSDTMTKPTPEMRQAMFDAIVGDDVWGEDPTIIELEELAASMFDKECGLYLPTATMGNIAAAMSHCTQRGMEVIVGDESHIFLYEQGGMAQLAGLQPRTIRNKKDGTFDLEELRLMIRDPGDVHVPVSGLICIENTHNKCGGKVLPLKFLDDLGALAKEQNLPLHVDGARIMHASVFLKESPARIAKHCDSVTICLSKGLRAPTGAVLVGTKEFIRKARRARKVLGGGMRQAGVIAATGIVALKSCIERLAIDHDHTFRIAQAIADCNSNFIKVDLPNVQTNILLIDVLPSSGFDAEKLCRRLEKITDTERQDFPGTQVIVKSGPFSPTVLRLVLHADINSGDVKLAIIKLCYVITKEIPYKK